MKRLAAAALIMAACGAVLTSCTQNPTSPATPSSIASPASGADPFIQLVQDSQEAIFEPYASPAAMLLQSTVALHGKVASVQEGRGHDSGGLLTHHIMVGIQPDQFIKDDPSRKGDLVYFELARPKSVAATEFAKGLPLGTEVALFAYPWDDPGFKVLKPDAGHEPGGSVYAPLVQGLWMASDNGFRSVLTNAYVSDGEWAEAQSWEGLRAAALTSG